MREPSYDNIEAALINVRAGRSLTLSTIVDQIALGGGVYEPFVALSRLFCRLKSADSIVEKALRKGLALNDVSQLEGLMPDLLGFRVVLADASEVAAMDEWICRRFEIVRRNDQRAAPGEFGERGIEYSARNHVADKSYPFEFQLRTFLQHHWASQSFHLFHKKDRGVAAAHGDVLRAFSAALVDAEARAGELPQPPPATWTPRQSALDPAALTGRVHLIVVEPGETLSEHVVLKLSGDTTVDHEEIVRTKLDLYTRQPSAAIVECSCVNFLSFHFNEPLVRVPPERLTIASS